MTGRRHGRRAAALLTLAACALGGCGAGSSKSAPAGPPGTFALGLPLDQAVAQVFAVGFAGTGPKAPLVARLRTRPWGAVVLHKANTPAPFQTRTLIGALRRAGARGGRPVPLIVVAEPHEFPGVRVDPQPSVGSPAVARDQARAAAHVMRDAGVRAVLAPDADLGLEAGPAAGRAFGTDPESVGRLTREAVVGWKGGRIASVVGRFPGEGAASEDPSQGPATVGLSLDALRQRDLQPFTAAIDAGAPAVLVSDALYTAFDGVTPAALAPESYRLLRHMGFEGAAMTADLVSATAAGPSIGRAAVDALRAGADLLYVPGDAANQEEAYRAVLAAVRSGRIPRNRLAEALGHVAALKRTTQASGA